MTKIDINEIHEALLGIMKAVHQVAIKNDIAYYMSFGTLLGAIRHKGFIPWDDDMDICVPRKDYDNFLECLRRDLPAQYKLQTYKDHPDVTSYFAKVEDTRTCLVSRSSTNNTDSMIGVNLDIFPMYDLEENTNYNKCIFWFRLIRFRYHKSTDNNWVKTLIYKMIKPFVFVDKYYINKKIDDYGCSLHGPYWGPLDVEKERNAIDKSVFGTPALYNFEGCQFYGPQYADAYLKHLYGNYMELPPENQRHYHANNVYRK